jgi:acyl-coenzyme A thioesterase PaaI-like protein
LARLSELGVDFDHWCFACGRQNPSGLHLDFEVSRGKAVARYTGVQRHQGYDGLLHGGVVTALLDETMGWAIFQSGVWGVTARITVTFKQPVPMGEELVVTGEIVRERGTSIETRGDIKRASDGLLLTEAQGLFMQMPEDKRRELSERYRVGEAFARIKAAVENEELSRT